MVGTVCWYNLEKGYGEIAGNDKQSYFFTWSELKSRAGLDRLSSDLVVRFEPDDTKIAGFKRAINVKISDNIPAVASNAKNYSRDSTKSKD